MNEKFTYIPKTDKQLTNWYNQKVRDNISNFTNFEEFKLWYDNSEKICHYCGLTEKESQKIVCTGKLESSRFPKNGIHGRGTSRGMWLEIDRYLPKGCYEIKNIVLCCYFCNNDKSDIFTGDQYKSFMENRLSFLKKILIITCIGFIASCQSIDNDSISEKQAKEIVENQIAKESNNHIELLEFKKTDGLKQEMFGMKSYLMKFHLKLRCKENVHQHFMNLDSYHFYSETELKKKLSLAGSMSRSDFKHFEKNEIIEFDDKNLFDKTENGWNY